MSKLLEHTIDLAICVCAGTVIGMAAGIILSVLVAALIKWLGFDL